MTRRIDTIIIAALAVLIILLAIPMRARAEDESETCHPHPLAQCCTRAEDNCGQLVYVGKVDVSAYYSGECGNVNHRGKSLDGLAGEIIATQSSGGYRHLLGETVAIVTPDGDVLIREVDDTGCMAGRLDLLVEDAAEMDAWGLRECRVYILEG